MALNFFQTSFDAGEFSPELYARTDLAKYKVGAARLKNCYIDYRGGAQNRGGTEFIDKIVGDEAVGLGRPRLIPFVYSTTETYVLVFADLLVTIYGNGVKITDFGSPYTTAELPTVKYTQSADVLTLTHPNHPPFNFIRTSPSSFTLTEVTYGTAVQPPTSLTGATTDSSDSTVLFSYVVTSVSADGKEESLPCFRADVPSPGPILGTQNSSSISLHWTAPSTPVSYYKVYRTNWCGLRGHGPTIPNSIFGYIGQSLGTSYSDYLPNSTAPDFSKTPPQLQDPFSPGQIASVKVTVAGAGAYGAYYIIPLIFSGGGGSGAAGYAIIDPSTDGVASVVMTNFGSGYLTAPTCTDAVGSATYSVTLGQLFGTYPFAVTYFQQRRVFGGTPNFPESLVASQTGNYSNFNTSAISEASDAITVSIASTQNNTIKSMVSMPTGLVVFSAGQAFLVTGGSQQAAITPSTVVALPQASSGANDLQPLVVNYDVLYCQNRGAVVRDLAFNFYVQSYTGTDRSVLASHLFDGYELEEWCYAEQPNRTIIVVRNDGRALCFTYVPEQEIFAWSWFETNGLFRSVCSVIEEEQNAVYFIVERIVGEYYLERLIQGETSCIYDQWYVDSGLALPRTYPAFNLQADATSGTITFTATAV